jgi:transposase-like protein
VSKKPPEDRIRRLAEAVVDGRSVRAAAAALGIPERTARGWVKYPLYQQYLSELRQQTFHRTVDVMASVTLKASLKVAAMLDGSAVADDTKVKALTASASALVALYARLGAGAVSPAVPGGLTVPGLDARFEAAPESEAEGDGGEGDPCEPTPE